VTVKNANFSSETIRLFSKAAMKGRARRRVRKAAILTDTSEKNVGIRTRDEEKKIKRKLEKKTKRKPKIIAKRKSVKKKILQKNDEENKDSNNNY